MASRLRRLSLPHVRRIALAAQGLADPPPKGAVNVAHFRRVLRRVGLLQIDSVNVLVRSHYLPIFSRLGPYDRQRLDDYAYSERRLFEYWGHAASLIPVEHYPLFRHRMAGSELGHRMSTVAAEHARYVDGVLDEVQQRGPLSVSALDDPRRRRGTWWSWGMGKFALEWHFARGAVTIAGRRGFTRLYDVPERVIPRQHFAADAPDEDEALRRLLLLSARSHGIGTSHDLADYYRLPIARSRVALEELAASGELEEVEVAGWKDTAYLDPEARHPRRIDARALLSPFDSLIWERDRTERLFGFRYRIEIYVPQKERVYGYYVLPFLLGDELVARVDLKSDRKSSLLLVCASHSEPVRDRHHVAAELAPQLKSMAQWLGLDGVAVESRGDLAPALRRLLG
ncbi:MAG TPA: crosslink repair DNA glycosylase YcaQ family protein [Dehalococcoidia bacterium]